MDGVAVDRIGVWSGHLGRMRGSDAQQVANDLEAMGYMNLWIPEGYRLKEIFSHASLLLAATDSLVVGSGVANIWARSPSATFSGSSVLGEAFPGRFILGLGVSHPETMAQLGNDLSHPVSRMSHYLDEMNSHSRLYLAHKPDKAVPLLLAALGPKMLELASARTSGAHTYFSTVSHTEYARRTLGNDAFLAVELGAVLNRDVDAARALARDRIANPISLGAYRRNLLRMGWSEGDLESGGSDRLVDALVVCGEIDGVLERVSAHLEAGADHVAVQFYADERASFPLEQYEQLAEAWETG